MLMDNPAERLLAVIEAGKKIAGEYPCKEAWKKLLVHDGSEARLLTKIAKVMSAADEAAELLSDLYPHREQVSNHWYRQVISAFDSQNLNGQWASFINQIDGNSILFLRMASELINAK